MNIISIEPTPNPNSMKLNTDESLPTGVSLSFTKRNSDKAPDYIKTLLNIEGIKSVFQTADFIAVERNPKTDWQPILAEVKDAFETIKELASENGPTNQVSAFVQMFRNIPMQVKVMSGSLDIRVALPPRFKLAANQAAALSENFLAERRWEDWGTFYEEPQAVGEFIADKIAADYDEERLNDLLQKALAQGSNPAEQPAAESKYNLQQIFGEPDPKRRLAALDQVEPTEEMTPALGKLLDDQNASIRRLAAAYLGTIGGKQVLAHLFKALKDSSVAVRRTAGDALSDIGDPAATGPMAEALKDSSKIVRWRAARFLYEAGDESALPALRAAQNDPEFEVKLQIQMAIDRIENGDTIEGGTAWQRMIKNDPDLQ